MTSVSELAAYLPIATWLALHPLAYFMLANANGASPARSRTLLTAYVVILAALPFQVPAAQLFLRAAAATVAVSYAVKAFELARGRVRDASVRAHFWRCVLWLMVPQDPRWPASPSERTANRRKIPKRVARALLKGLAGAALSYLGVLSPPLHWPFLLSATVTMFQFYFFATAIADMVGTLALCAGCEIDEIFVKPYLACSPADFWSRRWNLYIARFGARYIFFPWRKLGVVWASLLVFVASGVMHEYIVLAIFGNDARLGYMFAFFLVQWVGVTAQHVWLAVSRGKIHLRNGLAITLHLIWFVPTTVLFFEPVGTFLDQWWIIWRTIPIPLLHW
jgi:hypothetical protein